MKAVREKIKSSVVATQSMATTFDISRKISEILILLHFMLVATLCFIETYRKSYRV